MTICSKCVTSTLGKQRDLLLFDWPEFRDCVQHWRLNKDCTPEQFIEYCNRRIQGAYFFDSNYEALLQDRSIPYYDAWVWFEYNEDLIITKLWLDPAK